MYGLANVTKKTSNLSVVTREDSRLIGLATNGGYWTKCDSPPGQARLSAPVTPVTYIHMV